MDQMPRKLYSRWSYQNKNLFKKYLEKRGLYNDICLIKFKYEVECTPDIRPVCLASDLPNEGEKCRVAGFGDTTGNDNYSSILNEGILSIENHSYCNQVSFKAL